MALCNPRQLQWTRLTLPCLNDFSNAEHVVLGGDNNYSIRKQSMKPSHIFIGNENELFQA
jgi:hypothetical protein